MKTLKKRVLSGAMASVLAVSLAVPAFAASNNPDNTTVVTGTYQDVEIDVVVPTIGAAFINPYGLDLKVAEDANDSSNTNEVTISGHQIVSAPMAIMNKTAMDLNVNATVIGQVVPLTAEGAVPMKLASASTKGNNINNPEAEDYVAPATGKSAFVYLQAKSATDTTGTASAIATEYAAWAASSYNADTDVVVGTKSVSKEGLALLRAADMSGTAGAFAAYKAGSIAMFRLTGDCVASPKDAWTENDSFKATIAFTFVPAQIAKYGISVDAVSGSGTTAGVTVTPNVTSAAEGDTITITLAGVTAGETATITVTDADNGTVTVTPSSFTSAVGTTGTTATFAMPAKAVTIAVSVA